MKFEIKAQVVLRDKNGKITKIINKTVHSYVLQMIDILRANMNYTTDTIYDTTPTLRTYQVSGAYSYRMVLISASGDNTYGIQVGTGNDAILITDTHLKTLIAHGATQYKLSYGATSVGVCSTVGTSRNFTIARTLTNNSGFDITVNEVGLAVKAYATDNGTYFFLIEHSLLTFTIVNGTSGTVTYTISATV